MKKLLVLFLLVSTSLSWGQNPEGFEDMCKDTLKYLVPALNVDKFQALKDQPKSIILDAREIGEYNVSHIPGAIYIGYEQFKLSTVQGLVPKDYTIYVYCSIGYRSEIIADQIMQAGYKNVYNIFGGIFSWFNNGYELTDGKRVTNKIHGYDKEWSQWLNSKKGKIVLK